ncbi:PAS domain S-box protein [Geomonas silvestris]|uniref:PAS domain S-box protein n=1 Tax=Geomonas silvestris TaxID=2740184 RepID=UPI001FE89D96|nr:PAS domain S-box protein [Geomonas silvestris]
MSVLAAVLLSLLALSAQVYFGNQVTALISNQQNTLLTALADQIDDKLNATKTEVRGAASHLGPLLAQHSEGLVAFFAERPDTLAMFNNGLFLFSPAGRLIYASSPEAELSGRDFSQDEFFRQASSARKPLISEPFFSAQRHRHPIIMVTAPVLDSHGALLGVLAGSLDLTRNNFLTTLASIRLGQHGYLYLFNQQRTMIVHPNKERVLSRDVRPGANHLFDRALNGFEGTGTTVTSRNEKVISGFKRLKTTDWVLASHVPWSESGAIAQGARRYLLWALLVIFLITFLVVWVSMKHLTAPLLCFIRQVREMSGGKEGRSRVQIQTGDEIGVLADAFNQLLSELDAQNTAIKKQLDFSQMLIDCIPIPVFYQDVAGRYLGCNKAFEEVVGVTKRELVGRSMIDPALPQLQVFAETVDSAIDRTEIRETETLYADGRRRSVIMYQTAFPAADGSQGGVIAALLDITELKVAQDAHGQAMRKLQLILDAAGEGIYGIDLAGYVTFANPAALKMVGWQQEDLLGKHHSVLHHASGSEPFCVASGCPMHQALNDGLTRQVTDYSFWHQDGTSFPVEYVSTPILENGTLVGAVVIFKDTTERKQTEAQLTRLSQAVMQSPVPIVITDTSGNVEFVNPMFSKLSGYLPEEILGGYTTRLRSGKTRLEVYQSLWSTITAGSVWAGDLQNRHKDGDLYWVHCTISPIRDRAGAITHYMAFMESMTERKQLEEQLRQAQKMEAIGQLAGGVAHDFNNILTVIMGFGQLLQHSLSGDPANTANLKQILDAANRASHLTSSLLAFSRKQVMLLQLVELNDLTRNHTRFLSRIIGEDVKLETVLSPENLGINADAGQIEQVLMNLATNARDAMPNGGSLRIATEAVYLDQEFCRQHGYGVVGRYALLSISDTGTGMDAEMQQKIFEPFYTTKPSGRGTGLGLSIVYGIIKQHGGYITIESTCGIGTTFRIYLPLTGSGAGERAGQSAADAPRGGKETILVVEDDAMVRNMVDSVLRSYGYSVVLAENGEEALSIFETRWQEISLALLDVVMPGMNGRQVCEALRALAPQLKVLFLTGYTADVIKDRGILVDGIDLIPKPAQSDVLAKKIRDMLDAR